MSDPKRHGDETWLRVGDVVKTDGRKFRVERLELIPAQDEGDEDESPLGEWVAIVSEWNGVDYATSMVRLDAQNGVIRK